MVATVIDPSRIELIDGAFIELEIQPNRTVAIEVDGLGVVAYATPEQLLTLAREAADLSVLARRQPGAARPLTVATCGHGASYSRSCAGCGRSVT
jgi:hypothetical protein